MIYLIRAIRMICMIRMPRMFRTFRAFSLFSTFSIFRMPGIFHRFRNLTGFRTFKGLWRVQSPQCPRSPGLYADRKAAGRRIPRPHVVVAVLLFLSLSLPGISGVSYFSPAADLAFAAQPQPAAAPARAGGTAAPGEAAQAPRVEDDAPPHFLGSPACKACHAEIYDRFGKNSKKAVTRRQVEKMQPKLSPEEQQTCFRCHATGYGQRGGFVSYAQTPDLGDIGCETCHGPGSRHAASRDKTQIQRKPLPETCYTCHTPDRNLHSNFNPLLYGGAH